LLVMGNESLGKPPTPNPNSYNLSVEFPRISRHIIKWAN